MVIVHDNIGHIKIVIKLVGSNHMIPGTCISISLTSMVCHIICIRDKWGEQNTAQHYYRHLP